MKQAMVLAVVLPAFVAGSPGAWNGDAQVPAEAAGHSVVTSTAPFRVQGFATPPPPRRIHGRIRQPVLAERFQEALDAELESNVGVGASAAVITADHELWAGASGTSDETRAISPEMLFGIASITKTFVATVVLQLAEDGALTLDDPLDLWLAPLPNVDATATVRQLLNHTSGVYDFAEHPDYVQTIASDPSRQWTPEETIAAFVLEPYADPGVVYHYSNTGYVLLGLIIERAAGSRVSTEIRRRILGPLQLNSTFFAIEEEIHGEIAHPWADLDGNGVMEDIAFAPRTSGESTVWTAGAMYSSAEDLIRFLRALIQGEVLHPASLEQMVDFRQITSDVGYGLGIQETYDFVSGRSGVGHDGGTYGFSGRMICLPDQEVFVAVLLNHSSASPADDYATVHAISRALAQEALETN